MSKFDKHFTRKQLMNDREYCGQPIFIGWKINEKTGEEELNDQGIKIPLFDQCGKKMKPHKMKNWIKWECTRSGCSGGLYTPREPQKYSQVEFIKND